MRLCAITAVVVLGFGALAWAQTATTKPADGVKEETIQASAVPAKVMEQFKKDFPEAAVRKIEKETEDNGTVKYEFKFTGKDGKKQEVSYSADGKKVEDAEDDDDDDKN